jgi:A/G-specific adenine glycosylase
LSAYRDDPLSGAGQAFLWSLAEELLPAKEAGQFNQALMELGSLICKPREPQCDACPLRPLCPTQAQGLQEQIPQPKRKTNYEEVTEIAVVIRREQRVLVRQCAENERWAGLWDFVRFPLSTEKQKEKNDDIDHRIAQQAATIAQQQIELGDRFTTIKHGVTRFRITLHCYDATWVKGKELPAGMQWIALRDVEHLPLSVTGRKIAHELLKPARKSRQKKLFSV